MSSIPKSGSRPQKHGSKTLGSHIKVGVGGVAPLQGSRQRTQMELEDQYDQYVNMYGFLSDGWINLKIRTSI